MTDASDEAIEIPGGSVFIVFGLPTPWPRPSDVVALSDDASRLIIIWTSTGRIKAELRNELGLVIAKGESARIHLRGAGLAHVVFSASWNAGGAVIDLTINGAPTSTATGRIRLDATTKPMETGFPLPHGADKKSEETRRSRENRTLAYRKNNVDEDRQASGLAREVRLLHAAMERLVGGDTDEIVSVSLHLRKIIGRGNGNHALQDYAALKGLDLNVWAVPPSPPGAWTPKELGPALDLLLGEQFSAHQTPLFAWATDLDAWLSQSGGVVAGKHLNNGDMLHEIADKIGAHLDIGARPTLDRLSSVTSLNINLVSSYLVELGTAVLSLIQRIFDEE